MSGHRHAAMALHALTPRDQELILAELPAPDQRRLRDYLAELDELGFDGAAMAPDAIAAPAPASGGGPADRLRAASAAALLEAIGQEHSSLIAGVLAIEAWPWAPDFLERLTPARRVLVRRALDGHCGAGQARAEFLLEACASALERARPAAPAPSRLAAFFAGVSAWTR